MLGPAGGPPRAVQEASAPDGLLTRWPRCQRRRSDAAVLMRDQLCPPPHAVDPAGAGAAADDLGLGQQVEDEDLLVERCLDDDGRLIHGGRSRARARPGQNVPTR